ncbi:MAG: hypothetical protein IPH20_08825 [Bacteroidales bacterium]|nr:hypothetical protein [Bacteroidales bacterium]
MKILLNINILAILLLLNGCIPFTSDYPITKKGNEKIDRNLAGEWNLKSQSGIYKIFIEPVDDGMMIGSYYRLFEKNNLLTNMNTGHGFISRINDTEYLNIKVAFGDSLTKDKYVFFKFKPIAKDSVELFCLSGLELDTVFNSSEEFAEFIKFKQDSFALLFYPLGIATRAIHDEMELPVTSLAQSMDFISPTISPDEVKDAFFFNKEAIYEAKQYFKSIVPTDYSVYVEFKDYKRLTFGFLKLKAKKVRK